MFTSSASKAADACAQTAFTLFSGDCRKLLHALPARSVALIVSSPPYFVGKEYDRSKLIADFKAQHEEIAPLLMRVLRPGGSICWQTGTHAHAGRIVPLDILVYNAFSKQKKLLLRNRIVWHFEHGVHAKNRFSGRHETILWFTKGPDYFFNLDGVRVPQKYPGKRHYKGPSKGEFSGNPAGKNPGDVWVIPNVKSRHKEKTEHPCQFPIAIPQRFVRALTSPNDLVLDPFAGASSTGIAALLESRRFIGAEIEARYVEVSRRRLKHFMAGTLPVRNWSMPVEAPNTNQAVAKRPGHFLNGNADQFT
jgi:adenine-specific DNA-methyltransferase